MSKRSLAVGGAVALSLLLAACGSSSTPAATSTPSASDTTASSAPPAALGKVGVILPDTKSSARWEDQDRPNLKAAFDAAGIESNIQNAQGATSTFATLCDSMINEGVKVLLITNLDSDSGKACLTKANAAGIKAIDYDRLTLGGNAAFYVSFDNVKVGALQAEGLLTCLEAAGKKEGNIVYINGAATDNNATLFKNGYDGVLKPLTQWKLVGDQTGEWDPTKAGTVFEGFWTQQNGKIDGAIVANDGMAGGVAAVLKRNSANIPITGQDATDEGLNRVLIGTQCLTVWKPNDKEAEAAAALAIALIKGEDTAALATGKTADSVSGKDVPSVLLDPVKVFKDQVKDVVAAGGTTVTKVCAGAAAAVCTEQGIK
jgi:D-xylose transport system substrate-binding protein